ncbi:hypothetical protein [Streptomyces lasiicapitis]|uniref:Uncharacterized protein n=2 Tax=Streptomyces lasiicapitis TaxID=1923961 RepID=A0ABQ2LJM8_9ACTN|nr:hypothetical protein [Streptomyces lasiicapitis]GGO34945.1 hypothetical protein GCM10012286_04830 [Streptomyces lasiicapitis]
MSKVRMGAAAAVMAAGMLAATVPQSSAAAQELELIAYTPKVQSGKVWGNGFYEGYKKVCISLLGQTLSGWVQLTNKCQNVSPSSLGSINTSVKCPTRGAFKTFVSGTRTNNRVDVKQSGGIYLECR